MDPHIKEKLAKRLTSLETFLSKEYELLDLSFHGGYMASAILKKQDVKHRIDTYYSPKRDAYTLLIDKKVNPKVAQEIRYAWEKSESSRKIGCSSGYRAYVDGSFSDGIVSFGAVILRGNKIVEELSGVVNDTDFTSSRQVGGELLATIEVAKWCIDHGINDIDIFYDYEGIEKWASKEWKARKELTRRYSQFIDESGLKIRWHKVRSHTGDKWNEHADKLAKSATKEYKKEV